MFRYLALFIIAIQTLALDVTSIQVYFSPKQGATEAIVAEIKSAKMAVVVMAYGFTSQPIAKALADALDRNVTVSAYLDRSNLTQKASKAELIRKMAPRFLLILSLRSCITKS